MESRPLPRAALVPRQRDLIHSGSSILTSAGRERSPRNLQRGEQVKSTRGPILFDGCRVPTQGGVSKEQSSVPCLPAAVAVAFPAASSGSLWKSLRIHAGDTGSGVLLLSCSSWARFPSLGWQFSLGRSVASKELLQHRTGARQASALPFVSLNVTMNWAQVSPWQRSYRRVNEHWPGRVK